MAHPAIRSHPLFFKTPILFFVIFFLNSLKCTKLSLWWRLKKHTNLEHFSSIARSRHLFLLFLNITSFLFVSFHFIFGFGFEFVSLNVCFCVTSFLYFKVETVFVSYMLQNNYFFLISHHFFTFHFIYIRIRHKMSVLFRSFIYFTGKPCSCYVHARK